MKVTDLPTLNACLNACATLFLLLGWVAIRRKNRVQHARMMIGALIASTAFLTSYVYYHTHVTMMTPYTGQGFLRSLYFFILCTHIPLAILIVPFIFAAVWFAIRGQFERHKKITRRLFPVWMYVSITGVLIYLLLYVF
jgi:putative membrane protein